MSWNITNVCIKVNQCLLCVLLQFIRTYFLLIRYLNMLWAFCIPHFWNRFKLQQLSAHMVSKLIGLCIKHSCRNFCAREIISLSIFLFPKPQSKRQLLSQYASQYPLCSFTATVTVPLSRKKKFVKYLSCSVTNLIILFGKKTPYESGPIFSQNSACFSVNDTLQNMHVRLFPSHT